MSITAEQIERSVVLARRYGATRLILFGSAMESPETARDLDLACEGVEGWGLYALGAKLEEELGVGVDLLPLSPPTRLSLYIARTGRVIYESRGAEGTDHD